MQGLEICSSVRENDGDAFGTTQPTYYQMLASPSSPIYRTKPSPCKAFGLKKKKKSLGRAPPPPTHCPRCWRHEFIPTDGQTLSETEVDVWRRE